MRILVVDDEPLQSEALTGALMAEGHEAEGLTSPEKALERVREGGVDLLLTDHRMPGMTGQELIGAALAVDPGLMAVIITAFGTVEDAVAAMKAGAFDYLQKPVDLDHLFLLIRKAERQKALIRENEVLKKKLAEKDGAPGIIGSSTAMQEVFARIHRVAETDATVLIRGESGTGKELAARAIHSLGPRKNKPFVAVNSAAVPENLLESELFGHEKGAFTGAVARREGRIEAAMTGTLFLDEIGDLPQAVQAKLLRFLQEKTFERLGSNRPIPADVRILTATNRDLEAAVREGTFREDLYYRINVVEIRIPPLRERVADIPELLDHFIKIYSAAHKRKVTGLTREVHDVLIRHPYPGNVRELTNIVENAVVMCRGGLLTLEDLPPYLAARKHGPAPAAGGLTERVEALEREMISQALEEAGNVQTEAARALGISERVLRYKMKKLGLGKKA